jgi:hypothetical protein
MLVLAPTLAHAQSVNIDLGAAGQAGATGRLVQLTALVTVLSLAPSLLVMATAFTRIVIVLSLLRSAIGAQGTPPNTVLIGLALFLTYFVMQPVMDQAWTNGLLPMTQGQVGEMEGLRLTAEPFRTFMAANVRGADLQLFLVLGPDPGSAHPGPGAVACFGARLHDRRDAARVRDGIPALFAVPRHRLGRRQRVDELGHDDAPAQRGVAAVQADLLRPCGRLAAGVRQLGAGVCDVTP